MRIKERIRNLLYEETLDKVKEKYRKNRYDFDTNCLTEKEIRCLEQYGALPPTGYNKYEPRNDVEFLIEMKRAKRPSNAQLLKKKTLTEIIKRQLNQLCRP